MATLLSHHPWIFLWLVMLVTCSSPPDSLPQQSAVTAQGGDSKIALNLRINQRILKPGDTAYIQLTATNFSKEVVVYESKDPPVLDIVVLSSSGTKILSLWSAQNPDKVLHRLELKPEESLTLEMRWNVPLTQESGPISIAGHLYQNSKPRGSAPGGVCINLCRP